MEKSLMKVIFMGTPDFAVPSLDLLQENFDVVGVITAPDRKSGRGQKITFSPVKEFALKKGLNVLQPTNLKAEEFVSELESLQADLQVVVAFRMLPEVVWDMPKYGTINLHASLLPQYRGAAPINWAVINGESVTGVTTFFIEKEIDTGFIIKRQEVDILPGYNAGALHDKLMIVGSELLFDTVTLISEKGREIETMDQKSLSEQTTKAPKIFKADCEINWDQEAYKVSNFIRGLSPYPAAWTKLNEKSFKIFEGRVTDEKSKGAGTMESTNEKLWIHCKDFKYEIMQIQMEGKKRMETSALLRGYSF